MKDYAAMSDIERLLVYDEASGVLSWRIDRHARKVKGMPAGWLTSGKNRQTRYINIRIGGRVYKAHRIIWFIHHGYWPERIDHIDGNGLNNKIGNLREVSAVDSARNKPLQRNNSSGQSGVSFISSIGKWRATISSGGKKITLGVFLKKEDAVSCRIAAERKLKYHNNHGRVMK